MRRSIFVFLSFIFIQVFTFASAQESSNILVFALQLEKGGSPESPSLEAPIFATKNESYTNQPYFDVGHSRMLFTQALAQNTTEQMDSFALDLNSYKATNLTRSNTRSEFSPTLHPSGKGFSTILVDEMGKQWLWNFDDTGKSLGKIFNQEPIGYHVWEDQTSVLAFVLGKPHTLQRLRKNTEPEIIDINIGPSLWRVPKTHSFSYTKQFGETNGNWLMSVEKHKTKAKRLAKMPQDSTYYSWLTDLSVITATGPMIVRWKTGSHHNDWKPWLDLSTYCKSVSRTHSAVENNAMFLAIVCHT